MAQNFGLLLHMMIKTLPKVNNNPRCENSPNLVGRLNFVTSTPYFLFWMVYTRHRITRALHSQNLARDFKQMPKIFIARFGSKFHAGQAAKFHHSLIAKIELHFKWIKENPPYIIVKTFLNDVTLLHFYSIEKKLFSLFFPNGREKSVFTEIWNICSRIKRSRKRRCCRSVMNHPGDFSNAK
jgi:hypothetical protein